MYSNPADLFDNIQFSRVRILPVGEKREKASTVFTLNFLAQKPKNAYLRGFQSELLFCSTNMCCDYKIDALSAGTKNPLPQSDNGFCLVRARTGAPDRIRTCDLKSRSLALYPTELQAHIWSGDPLLFILII